MTGDCVWIDLANSPHVLFFEPVIHELMERGTQVRVTARDFAQTVALSERLPVTVDVVGVHGGAGLAGKARTLSGRVQALRAWAASARPAVAVSHNSYAQVVAARTCRIPVMTAMDYEFQPANHLAFRCADLIAVPDCFPLDVLCRQGATPARTWRYHGLKEQITLAGFMPDPGYLPGVGVDVSRPVVVVRPPADMALYHRFENELFRVLLDRLNGDDTITMLVMPRTGHQASELRQAGYGDLLWDGEVLDGRELAAGADAVISAGGSMIREAAVLGTPAWSLFAGRLGAVDRTLIADGRLQLLSTAADVEALAFSRKRPAASVAASPVGRRLLTAFVDRLLMLADRSAPNGTAGGSSTR